MCPCQFCNTRDAALLEQQIATRQISQSQAAKVIGCNKSTVSRHMSRCVAKKVQRVARPEPAEVEGLNVVCALTTSHEKTLQILDDSLDEGDRRTALLALQTEIKQLELTAKLTGQLNEPQTQIDILMNPELVRLEQMIIETVDPETRVKFSERLAKMDDGNHDYV